MALSDHEYVNFSEDYELNYHLRKVKNRSQLQIGLHYARWAPS